MQKDLRFLKLKYWRQKLGLKQEDMAELLGFSVPSYSQKENGKSKFYLSEAIIIREAFNKILAKHDQKLLSLEDIFLD